MRSDYQTENKSFPFSFQTVLLRKKAALEVHAALNSLCRVERQFIAFLQQSRPEFAFSLPPKLMVAFF